MCFYYMTGTPEGSTESGFMEKPGIEPATPGLQGIARIHYTTGASQKLFVAFPLVETSTGPGGFMICVFLLYDGNSRRLNRKWFYGEAGIRTCDPWFTRHSAYPLHHGG